MVEPTTKRVVLWVPAPAILCGLWVWWAHGGTARIDRVVDSAAGGSDRSAAAESTDSAAADTVASEQRHRVPDPNETPPTGSDTPDFDVFLEQLVGIAMVANEAAKGSHAADPTGNSPGESNAELTGRLKSLDETGRGILQRIMNEIEDPDYRALNKLAELPSEDASIRGIARRKLCIGILRQGLIRKLASFEHGGSRRGLDLLVTSMLDSLPLDELLAQDLGGLLTGTKYLGVAHETPVLELIDLANEDRYLLPIVTAILETLWDNLQAEGARTSAELVHLALIFRADSNPAKRLVAMRYLLVADNGRYREYVLQEAIAARDEQLIAELTITAADQLEPKEAMTTLERLSLGTKQPLTMALMRLSMRDSRVIIDSYEQKLADGTRPDYRAELVTAAGFRAGAAGLKLAQLAFENDPDPAVRTRAMFAITGNADSRAGERTLMAALDDATFTSDPDRLGSVVFALENLARGGDYNAVDRVGKRLARRPGLREGDRRRLQLILRRALPSPAEFPPRRKRTRKTSPGKTGTEKKGGGR